MIDRGLFITFEGCEGTGKSTQMRLLAKRLDAAGVPYIVTREPGGTPLGEAIRGLLLEQRGHAVDARAELLLYEASRAQLVAEVIEPGLAARQVVLCDRFADSTVAYQGGGRGLPTPDVEAANEAATGGLAPDLTLLFDVDVTVGLERATRQGADRLESEGVVFHERVRAAFLDIARRNRDRVVVIDGSGTPEAVAARTRHAVASALPALAHALRDTDTPLEPSSEATAE